jgi:hypothetical protein
VNESNQNAHPLIETQRYEYPLDSYTQIGDPQTTYKQAAYPQIDHPQAYHPLEDDSRVDFPWNEFLQNEYLQNEYPQTQYLQDQYPQTEHQRSEHLQDELPQSSADAHNASVTQASHHHSGADHNVDAHASHDPEAAKPKPKAAKVNAKITKNKFRHADENGLEVEIDGEWMAAIEHPDYVKELPGASISTKQYKYGRETNGEVSDMTAYLPDQHSWGEDRDDRPDVLFQYKVPSTGWPSTTPSVLTFNKNGIKRIVVDVINHRPLKDFRNLPITISKKVEGWLMEAWERQDRNIEFGDIVQRMSFTTDSDVWTTKNFRNALTQRRERFRSRGRCLAWRKREHNREWDIQLKEEMEANPTWLAANTTRYLEDLSGDENKAFQAATLLSRKHMRKANGREVQGEAKIAKEQQMLKLLEGGKKHKLGSAGAADDTESHVQKPRKRATNDRLPRSSTTLPGSAIQAIDPLASGFVHASAHQHVSESDLGRPSSTFSNSAYSQTMNAQARQPGLSEGTSSSESSLNSPNASDDVYAMTYGGEIEGLHQPWQPSPGQKDLGYQHESSARSGGDMVGDQDLWMLVSGTQEHTEVFQHQSQLLYPPLDDAMQQQLSTPALKSADFLQYLDPQLSSVGVTATDRGISHQRHLLPEVQGNDAVTATGARSTGSLVDEPILRPDERGATPELGPEDEEFMKELEASFAAERDKQNQAIAEELVEELSAEIVPEFEKSASWEGS